MTSGGNTALMKLFNYQLKAVNELKNGNILCGGVGSGKSITSAAYYIKLCGGQYDPFKRPSIYIPLYIITTARKRDDHEWQKDLAGFCIPEDKLVIDSWNNIAKYSEVKNAVFIFDEQRVVGYGAWSKNFIKITRNNQWILLSATPGDTWSDYIPVFIANGFYKNKTDFERQHVIYSKFSKYPRIDKYINLTRLIRLRDNILVNMDFNRQTVSHDIYHICEYDSSMYKSVMKSRWNIFEDKPTESISELTYVLRKLINSDVSRLDKVIDIAVEREKVIVFYNFDYELELLKSISLIGFDIAEWNGHKHQPIPTSDRWIYLVQYTAGAEGWNCIKTDTIIFYSLNYSYKIMQQSKGRIDRLNTPS